MRSAYDRRGVPFTPRRERADRSDARSIADEYQRLQDRARRLRMNLLRRFPHLRDGDAFVAHIHEPHINYAIFNFFDDVLGKFVTLEEVERFMVAREAEARSSAEDGIVPIRKLREYTEPLGIAIYARDRDRADRAIAQLFDHLEIDDSAVFAAVRGEDVLAAASGYVRFFQDVARLVRTERIRRAPRAAR